MKRREFIYTTTWGGTIGLAAPNLFAGTSGLDHPVLVVIQLAGGNDGLNTVIPTNNDHYYRARPTLAIKAGDTLSINDTAGLHPGLTGLKTLYDEGVLAIVEGVGYPNPNRSHFRSTAIWHAAAGSGRHEPSGWLGRYMDRYCSNEPAGVGVCIGNQQPRAFVSARPEGGITLNDARADASRMLKRTDMEAVLTRTKPAADFPNTCLARKLQTVSRLIQGRMPARIYFLSLGGFDTHTHQNGTHAALMKETGDALLAFNRALQKTGQHTRVATMVFSEFGRRVSENTSGGTDHGVAAPVFVLGGTVKGGLYGSRPGLAPEALLNGDPAHTVDYRSVYATLLEKHMAADSKSVLLNSFQLLDFMASA